MIRHKKKIVLLIIFLVPLTFILSQCLAPSNKPSDPRGDVYAGSASCESCHKNIYSSYLHTAHFMASQPANRHSIQGSFAKDSNEFIFNPHLKVVMEKRDSGYFQASYLDGKAQESQRFDIVFGGIKGQTYAYWLTNELFQLPISHINIAHGWVNSPGYDSTKVIFERDVNTRCINCHASYIKSAPPQIPGFYNAEGYDKKSLVLSIDCERCHGPAAAHVKFHTDNPDEKKAKYIIPFNSLTRQQKINMCAVCHSGIDNNMIKAAFDFKPGDSLNRYLKLKKSDQPLDYKKIDVHGNQTALLESSKCFINSKLVCATCHDTHVNDDTKLTLYAAKCMTCHNAQSHIQCKLTGQLGTSILANNCISCHMPAFPSKTIVAGGTGVLIHTHHIG